MGPRPMKGLPIMLDDAGIETVSAALVGIRLAGLDAEADLLENAYWAWLRITEAYVCAHPYVQAPEPGMTPISALNVVDVTLRHWSAIVPGSPQLDDEAVLRDAANDEAWHREEDRRMRREAGETV